MSADFTTPAGRTECTDEHGHEEARARGLSANDLVRAVGPLVGGKGGGKDDVAQGGGTDASRIDEALAVVRTEVATA